MKSLSDFFYIPKICKFIFSFFFFVDRERSKHVNTFAMIRL